MSATTNADISSRGRAAARALRSADTDLRDAALQAIATELERNAAAILAANAEDIAAAVASNTAASLVDRLTLDDERLAALAQSVRDVAALPDPVGRIVEDRRLHNGLELSKICVPIGRVLVVYESRPNVTVDVAALCIKSGNVALLRGSAAAAQSNAVLGDAIRVGLTAVGLPADVVISIEGSRDDLGELVSDASTADIVVPRGGEALKDFLLEKSRIPVLAAAGGICHVYLDRDADAEMAVSITMNAKVQRPGVCNAAETLLVHADRTDLLQPVLSALRDAGVELRGDERTRAAIDFEINAATDADWDAEYLDLILAVRVVDDLDAALDHIDRHSTGHSEAIVTDSLEASRAFTDGVDSACVYVNASTRFTDGGEYGMGAEVGNSTARLHVRGPIGLEALTTTKYVVIGTGQTRG
ncbi:MAG: glutamate-5-semialdehyde dehydrogenase [Thermoleophilia bacterium]|jgi:glutamate-5-semialdehyde dehydrogenase|nr:glutamate-5-semialdehyde dehydrogenase [Thermoleophilia bacterium]